MTDVTKQPLAFDAVLYPKTSVVTGRPTKAVLSGHLRLRWMPSAMTLLALLSILVTLLLVAAAGLRFQEVQATALAGALLVSVATRWSLQKLNWAYRKPLCAAIYATTLFAVFSLAGASASYAVATLTTGNYDTRLQNLDASLRFDWVTLYRIVTAYPSLQLFGVIAYRSIYVIPAFLLGYWAVVDRQSQSNRFLFEFWCCAVVTLVIFSFMPAAGPLAYLWHGPIPYMPDSELCQPQLIAALRIGDTKTIEVAHLCGLVSAPSFHAVAAVLYIRYALVIGRLKWAVIILSVAMLLSTPIEGTHYLIDILLGVVVAVSVMGIVECAVYRYHINRPLISTLP